MALSANTSFKTKGRQGGTLRPGVPVTSGAVIYHGALLAMAPATGTIEPCVDGTTQTFWGVAEIVQGDGTAGGAITGDGSTVHSQLQVWTDFEALLPAAATVTTATDAGAAIYAAADDSVTDVNTLGPQCGKLLYVPAANTAWVAIGASVLAKGA